MKKVKVQEIIEILDGIGLGVTNGSDVIEVEFYLNTGGTYYFTLSKDSMLDDITNQYNNFNMDEWVEEWVVAKHNGCKGVPAVRYLLDDADDVNDMLENVKAALDDLYLHTYLHEVDGDEEYEEYIELGYKYI